jgi:hypothetical protein
MCTECAGVKVAEQRETLSDSKFRVADTGCSPTPKKYTKVELYRPSRDMIKSVVSSLIGLIAEELWASKV